MPLTTDPVPVAPTPAPVQSPDLVTIPANQLARLHATSMQLDAYRTEAAQRDAVARAKELATTGQFTELMRQHQSEIAAEQERSKRIAVSAELSRAIAGYQLADPSAGGQLTQILAGELQATVGTNGYDVRSAKDFKPVEQFLAEKMASPNFQHFLAPQGRQAQGAAPQARGTQAPPVGLPAEPSNLGEYFVQKALAQNAVTIQVDPRLTGGSTTVQGPGGVVRVAQPSAAFGLRAVGR
jgi:hypothetical protein